MNCRRFLRSYYIEGASLVKSGALEKKVKKIFLLFLKKGLTKGKVGGIIDEPHQTSAFEKGTYRKELLKNFEKNLKKF